MYTYSGGVIRIPYGDSADVTVTLTSGGSPYMLADDESVRIDLLYGTEYEGIVGSGYGYAKDQTPNGVVTVHIPEDVTKRWKGTYRCKVLLCKNATKSADMMLDISAEVY